MNILYIDTFQIKRNMDNKIFDKPALNIDEKINLLKKRWLIFENRKESKHDLQHIWYFRMTGYFKFFQNKVNNEFINWTTFKQVLDLYIFDRKLRLLTLDAIEKIEVSLKANISDYMSERYWVFWYLDKKLFNIDNNKIYKGFIDIINDKQQKSSAIFIKEYFNKYDENYLPCWMLFEELTIWELSNIYRILKTDIKQSISDNYWLYQLDLQIWAQLLVNVRNISAHHSRLWNKEYVVKPRRKDKVLWKKYSTFINNINWWKEVIPNYYNVALIINYLLKHINKKLDWLDDLEKLFNEYSLIEKEKMWFKNNWRDNFK